MYHYATIVASIMIVGGAAIMLVNIIRFRKTMGLLNRPDVNHTHRHSSLALAHQGLMVFFLVGYLAVTVALLTNIAVISELFVGLIFLLGAVFVWLGIMLQHHMIAMVQSRYEQAAKANAALEKERAKLQSTNRHLNTEVAERRQAETALRESEQRLRFILDQLPTGTLIIDESTGIIKNANPAALELFGLPVVRVIGAPYAQVVRQFDRGQEPASQKDLKAGDSARMVIEAGGRDVTLIKNTCRISLDGRPHFLESYIDVSEKEELERRLRRAQRMEALGTLAGGVAHDLNNILSGIVSYPDLLLREMGAEDDMRKPIETIKRSGEKAATIIQDMLALARRGVVVKDVINLKEVVRDYLKSPEHSRIKAYHPQVSFLTQIADDIFNILGSPVHLFKTVMNLCSNAAEAMPEGGTVTITAENRYVDRPLPGYDTVEEGEYVVLSLSDTGMGISKEDHERIFEPFFTKKRMGRSGTGLGMAVVWGTVKDHSGYIDVKSEPAKGTEFTLYFPATRQKIESVETTDCLDVHMGNGEKILIVDDVVEQRDLATDMLTLLNYNSHAVESGEQAVAYLVDHTTDLVLLDMIMDPGMGGLQTYQEILKIHPGQRALLVSGYSATDDVGRAQALGAGEYLKKPYSLMDLAKAIREELQR